MATAAANVKQPSDVHGTHLAFEGWHPGHPGDGRGGGGSGIKRKQMNFGQPCVCPALATSCSERCSHLDLTPLFPPQRNAATLTGTLHAAGTAVVAPNLRKCALCRVPNSVPQQQQHQVPW